MSDAVPPARRGVHAALRRWLPWDVAMSDAEFERRQRAMVRILWLHVPVLAAVGLSTGWSVPHAIAELLPAVAITLVAAHGRASRTFRMVMATTGLVLCSSLLIHATGGLVESHFHFFAVVAVVTLYQAWAPFLVCLFWVVFHHAVIGVIAPDTVYNHPAAIAKPVLWAVIHASYILLASAAAVVAWRLTVRASQRAARLLDATTDGVYGRDANGEITFVNAAVVALLGEEADAVVGRSDHEAFRHPHARDECALCDALASGTVESTDAEITSGDGTPTPVELTARPLAGTTDEVAVTFRDVTEQRRHEAELERLALEDPLTGLPNRTLLMDRLGRSLARLRRGGPPFAVLAIDLDRFKEVNDTLGHGAGDELLCEAGERLVDVVREVDSVARLGGDEFVVLLGDVTDLTAGLVVAERVRAAISAPYWIGGVEAYIGASCGLRLVDDGSVAPDLVLREADTALYASKRGGRGRVTAFDGALGRATEQRFRTANELHRAVGEDDVVVHYQPKVNLANLHVTGFEALVRWDHPERGLLLPADFLEVAEDSAAILPLGEWVLRAACRQLQEWHDRAPELGLFVAVNVSTLQVRDGGFVDALRELLDEHDFPPSQLWVEITESTLMQEPARSSELLVAARALGVTLAIDDFGTGYSSLAGLRSLPVDALKIDHGFVHGLHEDTSKHELVVAVVGMAEALGLRIVAEGVETAEDLAALREILLDRRDHHLAQGWFLAEAMPADEATWLVDEEARAALLGGTRASYQDVA